MPPRYDPAVYDGTSDADLVTAYLRFREDYYSLGSGLMKDEAMHHFVLIEDVARRRGISEHLVAAVAEWRAERKRQYYQSYPWLKPAEATP